METTLLVTKVDFAAYADLPESLELDRLRPHILAVQSTRLRLLLTATLLDELLRQQQLATVESPMGVAWAKLLEHVVPVVCCAALARYMPFAQNTAVSNGFVVKKGQYSEASDGRDLARMATIYDGEALTHEVHLTTWLKANASLFTGFYPQTTCCGATEIGRTSSVVVQAIRRPDDVPGSYPSYRR
jgi:hypothetical protein